MEQYIKGSTFSEEQLLPILSELIGVGNTEEGVEESDFFKGKTLKSCINFILQHKSEILETIYHGSNKDINDHDFFTYFKSYLVSQKINPNLLMELESEYVLNIKKHITCKIQSHILSILSKDVQEKIGPQMLAIIFQNCNTPKQGENLLKILNKNPKNSQKIEQLLVFSKDNFLYLVEECDNEEILFNFIDTLKIDDIQYLMNKISTDKLKNFLESVNMSILSSLIDTIEGDKKNLSILIEQVNVVKFSELIAEMITADLIDKLAEIVLNSNPIVLAKAIDHLDVIFFTQLIQGVKNSILISFLRTIQADTLNEGITQANSKENLINSLIKILNKTPYFTKKIVDLIHSVQVKILMEYMISHTDKIIDKINIAQIAVAEDFLEEWE